MRNARTLSILALVCAGLLLAAGCRGSGQGQPKSEQPKAEHRQAEHPKAEHPAGEHPK